jgi:hypothetical protein
MSFSSQAAEYKIPLHRQYLLVNYSSNLKPSNYSARYAVEPLQPNFVSFALS